MPPFRWRYLLDSIDPGWRYYRLMTLLGGEAIEVRQNLGEPDAIAAFVHLTGGEATIVPHRQRDVQLVIVRHIASLYCLVMPVLFPVSVLLFFAVAIRKAVGRERLDVVIFGAALLLAAAARIVVLAYLYATTTPLMSGRYLAPAIFLAPAFTTLTLSLASAEAFRWANLRLRWRQSRSVPRSLVRCLSTRPPRRRAGCQRSGNFGPVATGTARSC